jgi:hypothetical protein
LLKKQELVSTHSGSAVKAKMLLLTLVVYIHFVASKRAVIERLAKNLCQDKIASSDHVDIDIA